jgi:hypothetical protein
LSTPGEETRHGNSRGGWSRWTASTADWSIPSSKDGNELAPAVGCMMNEAVKVMRETLAER